MTTVWARLGLRQHTRRTVLAVALALVCTLLPMFLTGALSGSIGRDLEMGEAGLGTAITAFFLLAALGAAPAGRLADRLGPPRALLIGTAFSAVVAATIGLASSRPWHLIVLLGVAGLAVGLVDTGGARAFSDALPARRHGAAFGLKEASVPAASMLAGMAVPLVALTAGWRLTYLAGLLLAPAAWLLLPRTAGLAAAPAGQPSGAGPSGVTPLRLAVGAALGGAAAAPIAAFMVPGATAAGLAPEHAGWLLAVASAIGIGVRVGVGWRADSSQRPASRMIAVLMVAGTLGLVLLALGGTAATIAGGLVALGGGWGWTGLVFLAAVRARPAAPAAAAGVALTGLGTGGAAGPLVFGVLAGRVSYASAWILTAVLMLAGAAVLAVHRTAPMRPDEVTGSG